MNDNLISRLADIEKRLLALKALRKVDTSQISVMSEEWEYIFTLQADGDPDDYAEFQIEIECAGDPIADIAVDNLPYGNTKISVASRPTLSGNTVNYLLRIFNNDTSSVGLNITIRAFALNGLSASIERTA